MSLKQYKSGMNGRESFRIDKNTQKYHGQILKHQCQKDLKSNN